MAIDGWPPTSDQRDRRPARSGCVPLVGIAMVLLLGVAFVTDLGVSSFVCMDTQGDNLACAFGLVLGRIPLYLAGAGVIGLIVYAVRRATR